jgi:hypothetical protein
VRIAQALLGSNKVNWSSKAVQSLLFSRKISSSRTSYEILQKIRDTSRKEEEAKQTAAQAIIRSSTWQDPKHKSNLENILSNEIDPMSILQSSKALTYFILQELDQEHHSCIAPITRYLEKQKQPFFSSSEVCALLEKCTTPPLKHLRYLILKLRADVCDLDLREILRKNKNTPEFQHNVDRLFPQGLPERLDNLKTPGQAALILAGIAKTKGTTRLLKAVLKKFSQKKPNL